MKNLELQKCILGPVYTNCYFLKNKTTGEMIVIDPADFPEKIYEKVILHLETKKREREKTRGGGGKRKLRDKILKK